MGDRSRRLTWIHTRDRHRSTTVLADFIGDSPTVKDLRVFGNKKDTDRLALYVKAGYRRQDTPKGGVLNGLHALEIGLSAICERQGIYRPTVELLVQVYRSKLYLRLAEQLANSFTNPGIGAAEFDNLMQGDNLSVNAMRLMLVVCEHRLKFGLQLGIVSPSGTSATGATEWEATIHEPILEPSTKITAYYTIWVIKEHRHNAASDQTVFTTWYGVAPLPAFQRKVESRLPKADIPGSNEAHGRDKSVSTENATIFRELRANQSVDPVRRRKAYPEHLTEEDLVDRYPDEMHWENLLYVLRRYRQAELLALLAEKGIKLERDALRQRKRAALDRRAKERFEHRPTVEQRKLVSREYDDEISQAGFYGPRMERGARKRKQEDEKVPLEGQRASVIPGHRAEIALPLVSSHESPHSSQEPPAWLPDMQPAVWPPIADYYAPVNSGITDEEVNALRVAIARMDALPSSTTLHSDQFAQLETLGDNSLAIGE